MWISNLQPPTSCKFWFLYWSDSDAARRNSNPNPSESSWLGQTSIIRSRKEARGFCSSETAVQFMVLISADSLHGERDRDFDYISSGRFKHSSMARVSVLLGFGNQWRWCKVLDTRSLYLHLQVSATYLVKYELKNLNLYSLFGQKFPMMPWEVVGYRFMSSNLLLLGWSAYSNLSVRWYVRWRYILPTEKDQVGSLSFSVWPFRSDQARVIRVWGKPAFPRGNVTLGLSPFLIFPKVRVYSLEIRTTHFS